MTGWQRLRHLAGRDEGQITAFVVVMMAALILLAGLVLDGGLTLAARERALGQAQQAGEDGGVDDFQTEFPRRQAIGPGSGSWHMTTSPRAASSTQ